MMWFRQQEDHLGLRDGGGVRVAGEGPAGSAEWDAIWQACDYATFFHSREWSEIWQAYSDGAYRPDPVVIEFTDGKKAILPISSERTRDDCASTLWLTPAWCYGGWISADNLEERHAGLLTNHIMAMPVNTIWRVNPFDAMSIVGDVECGKKDDTHALDMTPGFDAILARWSGGHRYAIRRARKEGVLIRKADSLQDWRTYYELYEDSLSRWGDSATSRYSWSLFDHLFRRASPNTVLWLAIYKGRIVAGALVFYARNHAVYWHGAALAEYFHARPVHLILHEAISEAVQSGRRWFDFNPSGGHEGVRGFKREFGAEVLGCPVIINRAPEARYSEALRKAVKLALGGKR